MDNIYNEKKVKPEHVFRSKKWILRQNNRRTVYLAYILYLKLIFCWSVLHDMGKKFPPVVPQYVSKTGIMESAAGTQLE